MQIDKSQVLDLIKSKAGDGKAKQADAELLSKYGIDPKELIGKFGGGLGGLGG